MIRVFNHYLSGRVLVMALLDACVLFAALMLGHWLRLGDWLGGPPLAEATIFAGTTLVAMSALGLYESGTRALRLLVARLLVASLVSLFLLSALFYVFQEVYVGRGVLLYSISISMLALLILRAGSLPIGRFGGLKRRVLLLGNPSDIARLRQTVDGDERFSSVKVCGTLPVVPEAEAREVGLVQPAGEILRLVGQLDIEEIVIAASDRRGGVLPLRDLLDCKLQGISVLDSESFCERQLGIVPLDNLRASWLLAGDPFPGGRWRDAVKRVFDILVSGTVLLLVLPVLLLTALAIKLDSPGPVIYSQLRTGYRRRVFRIYKLRSMRSDSEADGKAQWAAVGDARVTRVGHVIRKLRIDELPQLWNVLKGEMSFVGPRPERPEFVKQLMQEVRFYDVRHGVKPGLTGWAQVRYPYGASIDDARSKLQYDLYYVKNHSLFLDLVILLETMQVVIFSKGAR